MNTLLIVHHWPEEVRYYLVDRDDEIVRNVFWPLSGLLQGSDDMTEEQEELFDTFWEWTRTEGQLSKIEVPIDNADINEVIEIGYVM